MFNRFFDQELVGWLGRQVESKCESANKESDRIQGIESLSRLENTIMPAKVQVKSRSRASKSASASELFSQAQLALQYDEVDEAVELMKKAVRLEPENAEVRAAMDMVPCNKLPPHQLFSYHAD